MAVVQHEKPSQRLVPSGKVYRQMFDAEVQLVKSLEKTKITNHGQHSAAIGNSKIKGIPVVHMKFPVAGMMDERQLHWLEEFPNEPYTENPIVYKFYEDEVKIPHREIETAVEEKEVHGLPDVVVPSKVGSDVIERIAATRKLRHEAALEDLYHNLGQICTEMEPQIASLCETMVERMNESDVAAKNILLEIMSDKEVCLLSMSTLKSVWEKVSSRISMTKDQIEELDFNLAQLEKQRMEKVRSVFEGAALTLEKIGHLVMPDLQRLLDKECQIINQMVLANKRAYADLHGRLMVTVVEQEKNLYVHWAKRVDHCKEIHKDAIITRFKLFMESDDIVQPTSVQMILNEMIDQQRNLNQQRIDLISSIREFQPPACTKTLVAQWHQKIIDLSKNLDSVNQLYFNKLCSEYERICQTCLKEIEKVKIDLIDMEVCTEDKATEIINAECLPLVGEQQAKYEQVMEEMDRSLEQHSATVLGRLKVLFKFCQHLAHCWDLHEINLSKLEKELKEKLEQVRLENEITNQESVTNLDDVLDRLRQGASESILQEELKKALTMLENIEKEYVEFHQKQSEVMAQYPEAVQTELSGYDQCLCRLLGIRHAEIGKKPEENFSEGNENALETEEATIEMNEVVVDMNDKTVEGGNNLRLLVTKGGTKYELINEGGILKPSGEARDAPKLADDENFGSGSAEQEVTFFFKTPSEEIMDLATYLKSFDIEEKVVKDSISLIQLNMLNHLDEWMIEAYQRAKAVVEAKNSELKHEFEIRMHLHEPRAKRIECDIHNVRAAELVMHSERVSRHCKGAEQSMAELRLKCSALTEDHNKLADKFVNEVEKLETVFKTATKSSILTELSQQLKRVQEKFMDEIRASIRQFCQQLDHNLQILHQSTTQLIKSFKLFSDGGNFCPAEVEEFRSRLNKLSTKIDQCEASIMGSLESIEAKRLDQALKVIREFEDRYKYHMVDLAYLEKISRWMLNTQVKIKGEVAFSNTSAKMIADSLDNFERQLAACERPNPDKQPVLPSSLVTDLVPIYEAVQKRSVYLQCLKDPLSVLSVVTTLSPSPSSSSFQGSPLPGGNAALNAEGLQCISKPGKLQLDDPSIAVIRNILRSQRLSKREGASSEGKKGARAGSAKSKKKSAKKEAPKKTRNVSGKGKIDKKYFVFGEEPEAEEENQFKGRIRQVLRVALDALLTASELYYRQKGIRQVTRPDVLKDNFDDCAEVLVQRCQSYFTQCEDYHNECLQELRHHLSRLETLAGRVPHVLLNDLKQKSLKKMQALFNQAEQEYAKQAEDNRSTMELHENELRPCLGHPQNRDKLEDLFGREKERTERALSFIAQHTKELDNVVHEQAKAFLQDLARKSENLFVQYDNMLVVDEIQIGRQPNAKFTSSELIRRHKEGQSLTFKPVLVEVARGKNTWPGIPTQEMKLQSSPPSLTDSKSKSEGSDNLKTASITTMKTTLGHQATIKARDAAYEEFKAYALSALETIKKDSETRKTTEERFFEKWKTSVDKVKHLYD